MTDTLLTTLWTITWQSAILAAIVWGVIAIFGKRLRPQYRYLLWCVVLVRLMLPVLPTMPWMYPQIADDVAIFTATQWRILNAPMSPIPQNVRPEGAQDLAQGNALDYDEVATIAALQGQEKPGIILPLQGGKFFVGSVSQGVALG